MGILGPGHIHIHIYIYREREREIYIYIYMECKIFRAWDLGFVVLGFRVLDLGFGAQGYYGRNKQGPRFGV